MINYSDRCHGYAVPMVSENELKMKGPPKYGGPFSFLSSVYPVSRVIPALAAAGSGTA